MDPIWSLEVLQLIQRQALKKHSQTKKPAHDFANSRKTNQLLCRLPHSPIVSPLAGNGLQCRKPCVSL